MSRHRLFTIPELLLQLFSIIESESPNDTNQTNKKMASRTLASCALVCRTWEEFATEYLWRDLPSALCLLGVLGPLTYRKDVDNKGWDFASPITDWNRIRRFLRLANYVDTLTHQNERRWANAPSSIVSRPALRLILPIISQNSNPIGGIFLCPRLRELRWISILKDDHSLPRYLTPPSLRNLDVWPVYAISHSMTWDEFDSALGTAMGLVVAGVHSELEAFQFRSDIRRPTPSCTKLLAQFLSRQTRLIKVDIYTSLTKSVATALGTSSQSLRMLTCHINPRETGASIKETMELISLNCSTLEELVTIIDGADFGVSDIKPLFRCKTLRKLRIKYRFLSSPFVKKDFEAMAASWPNLQALHLFSNAYSRPQTPLSILTTIAQCMQPTLQDLGIEIFADETVELETSPAIVGFSELRHLVLGYSSTVKDGYEPDVANYLASICPPSVEISMGSQTLPRTPGGSLGGWNAVAVLFKHSCLGAGEIAPWDPNCSSSSV